MQDHFCHSKATKRFAKRSIVSCDASKFEKGVIRRLSALFDAKHSLVLNADPTAGVE